MLRGPSANLISPNPISVFPRAKLVDVILALNSTRFLWNETAYVPWESAVRNLEYFVLMFDRSEVYGPMQACVIKNVLFNL